MPEPSSSHIINGITMILILITMPLMVVTVAESTEITSNGSVTSNAFFPQIHQSS